MLWVELHLPSGTKYVSNEAIATDSHFWEPHIASFGQFKFAMDSLYGGYVRPQYGRMELLPSAFLDDWPPPKSFAITVHWADHAGDLDYITLLDGTAVCTDDRADGIVYQLYEREFTGRFTDHVYDGAIAGQAGLFVGNVPSIDPNLGASYALGDDTNAPLISYTDTGDQLVLDSLSKACATGTHMFYRDVMDGNGLSMVLVDMFTDNGTMTIDEFDFFSTEIRYNAPVPNFRCGDTSVAGGLAVGKDMSITSVFNTDAAELTKGLNRIKQVMEAPQITVKMPLGTFPKFGQRIELVSEARMRPVNAWLRVRGMVIDFDSYQVTLTGDGGIS